MNIGFIGLGRMGAAIAANLLNAGHSLTVYSRTPAKSQALGELGASVAREVADACHGDVAINMLADDAAVDGVAFGAAGVIANLRAGAIHVSMSTISVGLSERLTAAHAGAGQRYVAAPVFGRPEAAAAAKLFVVAAGPHDAIAACQPLFDALGQRTFPIAAQPPVANLIKLSATSCSPRRSRRSAKPWPWSARRASIAASTSSC